MRSKRGLRRRYTAAIIALGVVAVGCTGGDDEQADKSTTSASVTPSQLSTADGLTLTFATWYNAVTSGDASPPTCVEGAPVWVAAAPLTSSSSGPLLVCADHSSADELVLHIVNNASGPLSIDYPDALARWELASDDPDGVTVLAGDTGALVRPGVAATLTAGAGSWDKQDLSLAFTERWAIIEATSEVMTGLGLENTFAWATGLADACDVDAVAASNLGAPLEAALHEYFNCVFDALGDAVEDTDREALTDVVPLVSELVERAKNVASQQRAGAVLSALLVQSQLPEPAGPSIDDTTTTTVAIRTPTTRPPTTKPPTTRAPTTAVPTTVAPTSPPPTAPSTTTTTVPKKVSTTQEDPELTVPLPPAPVLVALETVQSGVDTYTAWPAIDPKLARLSGGQIVVIECKAFSEPTVSGGNGWWYRIGSGDAAGGWASATGFKNLVPGVEAGSTSPRNVNEALSAC